MLLENRTGEGIYYSIQGIDEKIFLPSNEMVEIEWLENFTLKLFHNISSDYHLERFTKSPKCEIRVNTTYFISHTKANTKIILRKCEQPIDYIFSYILHCCSINIGEIANIEYDIINSELLIAKHRKHLKKDLNHEFLLIPFVFLDLGLTMFIWKWYGLKTAMIVLFLSLILCFLINAMVTLLFSYFKKSDKEYLKYFTTNFIKMFIGNTMERFFYPDNF